MGTSNSVLRLRLALRQTTEFEDARLAGSSEEDAYDAALAAALTRHRDYLQSKRGREDRQA